MTSVMGIMAASNQALTDAKRLKDMIHHSDYGIIDYTDKMADCEVIACVGTIGNSYDNALAEIVNELYKSKVIEYLKDQ